MATTYEIPTIGGFLMLQFIDVHDELDDVTPQGLTDVYRGIQQDDVHFKDIWADHGTGTVFCWCEAASAEAVHRLHEQVGHPVGGVYEVRNGLGYTPPR
jgi:hypothetical protein